MTDFKDAKKNEFEVEVDRVTRALERAVRDFKPVDAVLYAMRIDWLMGVNVFGTTA